MTKEKIFVGFAFTGGIGSHPGILTSSEIEKMGNDNFGFEPLEEVEEIPSIIPQVSLWRSIFDGLQNCICPSRKKERSA